MPWDKLLQQLLEFFASALLEWLREALKKGAAGLHGDLPPSEAVAVAEAFAAARAKLTWLDRLRGRGARLDRCERVALVRAAELVRAAKGEGDPPVMTTAELERSIF